MDVFVGDRRQDGRQHGLGEEVDAFADEAGQRLGDVGVGVIGMRSSGRDGALNDIEGVEMENGDGEDAEALLGA